MLYQGPRSGSSSCDGAGAAVSRMVRTVTVRTVSAISWWEVAHAQHRPDNRGRLASTHRHGWKWAMAQQTTVRFIDDLDGSDASGTFDFSLGGRNYQIDLSDDNAAKLRDALAPYIDVARKAGSRSGGRGRPR